MTRIYQKRTDDIVTGIATEDHMKRSEKATEDGQLERWPKDGQVDR